MAMAQHKNLSNAPRTPGAFAAHFRFDRVLAPDNGHFAKTLNLRSRKFEAYQLAARRLKLGCGLKNLCLILPLRFSRANHKGVRRDQLVQHLRIVCKPSAPYGLAHLEQVVLTIGSRRVARRDQPLVR